MRQQISNSLLAMIEFVGALLLCTVHSRDSHRISRRTISRDGTTLFTSQYFDAPDIRFPGFALISLQSYPTAKIPTL